MKRARSLLQLDTFRLDREDYRPEEEESCLLPLQQELSAAVYNSEVQTKKSVHRSDHLLPTSSLSTTPESITSLNLLATLL